MRPPVALLGYVVDQPRAGGVLAVRRVQPGVAGGRAGPSRTACRCASIDLPLADVARRRRRTTATLRRAGASRPVDPLGALAAAAGDDDAERWWEDVVEHRGRRRSPAFDGVAEAMAPLRARLAERADRACEDAAGRRTCARRIRAAAARRATSGSPSCAAPGTCPRSTAGCRAGGGRRRALLRGLPEGEGRRSRWVPWTHRRLAAASGLRRRRRVARAGTHHVFGHPGPTVSPAGSPARPRCCATTGLSVSPDHLIAAVRLADGARRAARPPAPGLAEVADAADAVLAGGAGPLALVHDQLVVGDAHRLGARRRADGAARPRPRRASSARLRLKPEAERATLELDLRTPHGRAARSCSTGCGRSACRGARSRRAAARAARSGRPGRCAGSPS